MMMGYCIYHITTCACSLIMACVRVYSLYFQTRWAHCHWDVCVCVPVHTVHRFSVCVSQCFQFSCIAE